MAWFAPIVAAGITAYAAHRSQKKQAKHNKELAAFQADMNERYLDRMNRYNTPANQMSRFQEAGLNPHLIYGQGNPGNQSAPLQYPDITPTDMGQLMQMVPQVAQGALAASQVQAQNAQTRRTGVLTELDKLQIEVTKNNPLLNKEALQATISSIISSAEIKASESSMQKLTADWFTGERRWEGLHGQVVEGPAGAYKLQREVDLLEQRFKLGELDGKIKAEVLESKEFQNAILEVQQKWMTDGEMTPQHFLMFAQIILMKLLSR